MSLLGLYGMLDVFCVPIVVEENIKFLTIGHLVPKLPFMDIYYMLNPYKSLVKEPIEVLATEIFYSETDVHDAIKKIVDEFIR
jgi:hypothetical protein